MGKRSNFKRRERDAYATPYSAVVPLLPHLWKARFCEPCAGDGRLAEYLEAAGHSCVAAWDIEPRAPGVLPFDARYRQISNIDSFITNPPWDRDNLHAIIDNLASQHKTWLLIDAGWAYTKQAVPFMRRCRMIVAIGRVKWIEGSKYTGKDDCAWYLFDDKSEGYNTVFIARKDA